MDCIVVRDFLDIKTTTGRVTFSRSLTLSS